MSNVGKKFYTNEGEKDYPRFYRGRYDHDNAPEMTEPREWECVKENSAMMTLHSTKPVGKSGVVEVRTVSKKDGDDLGDLYADQLEVWRARVKDLAAAMDEAAHEVKDAEKSLERMRAAAARADARHGIAFSKVRDLLPGGKSYGNLDRFHPMDDPSFTPA